jgi:hypothetical protein
VNKGPNIFYNLPPIQALRGRKQDRNPFGLTDYLQQIEDHVGYTRNSSKAAQQTAKLAWFRWNLESKVLWFVKSLIASEKSNWTTLTGLFIKRFTVEQELKAMEGA